MFLWLEQSPVALWVSLSLWAYPALLSAHIVGLSIVAGLCSMRELRVLNLVSGPPASAFLRYQPIALAGLSLNVVSGLLLFSSQATVLVSSVPFLIKMASVLVASGLSFSISMSVRSSGHAPFVPIAPALFALKLRAALALICWIAAIVAGRLIAYVY